VTQLLAAVALLAALAACDRPPGKPEPVKPAPGEGGHVTDPGFPNVRARLRLTSRAPALPERVIEQTIWLDGSRFRVRDEAGRDLHEILGEATAKRGLGVPAKSMEDIMARRAAARRAATGATEIYGDLADDAGWIYPADAARWARPARELAPIATQILAIDRPGSLAAAGPATRLARPGTEYRGVVTIVDDGQNFDSAIDCVVAPPFLLYDQVRDPASTEHYYVRELLELAAGAVTAADLAPPAGQR